MNPVYQRLLEIARDQGQNDPVPNTYFQQLLSLSSGRISQICDPLSVAKIGPKGLSNLANLGYNPKWVNEGPPHRKWLANTNGMGVAGKETDSRIDREGSVTDLLETTPTEKIRLLFLRVLDEFEKTQGSFCTDFENQINDLTKATVVDHGDLAYEISNLLCSGGADVSQKISALPPTRSQRDIRIAEINKLLSVTDDYGIVAMLEKAKDVAKDYPASKQTASSSS